MCRIPLRSESIVRRHQGSLHKAKRVALQMRGPTVGSARCNPDLGLTMESFAAVILDKLRNVRKKFLRSRPKSVPGQKDACIKGVVSNVQS